MDTYRVTLAFMESRCAMGIRVDAQSVQSAIREAALEWDRRKSREYPGPEAGYQVTKVEAEIDGAWSVVAGAELYRTDSTEER